MNGVPDSRRWAHLNPLLDELLDLSDAARAEWLEVLRMRDPETADELDALWRAGRGAEEAGFLAGGPPGLSIDDEANDAAAEAALRGRRFGPYALESPVGQGGMGSVWRARRADDRFEGEVAIKLLHLSLLGRGGAQRFRREGAILARLAHPNIARLLDAGIGDGAQPYLVLEFVDGVGIDRYCDSHRLDLAARLALFADVLSAVAHAHSHLVIHRDIKPTNILVSAQGEVKLLDFGIAKLLEDEGQGGGVTDLTREGGRALTPEYAAPEQLRGEPVTTATDVYSLGVLLYRLLAGRHPTAPEGATPSRQMHSTLAQEPRRPSESFAARGYDPELADLARRRSTPASRLARQLRGDLDNVVARALRKDPAERYATVAAFAEDLRRYRAHEPVTARPDSFFYRSARFVRRHRTAVAASVIAGAAILAGLAGTVSQARRAERQAEQARIERDGALGDLAFATAARELLSFLVSQGDGRPMTASELLARAERLVDQQFGEDASSRGRLQLMLGIEYGNLLESDRSMAVLVRAQGSARAASQPALLSNVDCLIAATLGDQGRAAEAMPLFGDAIQRMQVPANEERSVLAACLQMRAALQAQLGHAREMLVDAQAARAALGTPRDDQRVLASSIGIQVAEAQGRLGKLAPAIAGYESSIADMVGMGRQHTARMAVRYNNLGRLQYTAGLPMRAHEAAQRALAVAHDVAPDNELAATIEANDARALIELGRFAQAKSFIEQALASAAERKDPRWAGTFALYGAPAWCATGDLDRCAALVAEAREKLRGVLPPGHPNFGALDVVEAQWDLANARPDDARQALEHALGVFAKAAETSPWQVRALALLARTEQASGHPAQAIERARSAVALARESARDFAASAWLGEALVALATVQQAQGDSRAAEASRRDALAQLLPSAGEEAPATRAARGGAG